MTVAIALVSVQAMAYAPVIDGIPSPIVGNKSGAAGASQTTAFVYPDAFDLNTVVTDDQTSVQALKWSYEIGGTAKYAINGDDPINNGVDDPVAPPAAKTINQTLNGHTGWNEVNPDGKINTITIRNINMYPYGAASPTVDMTATGQNWATHMQPVTFWCSDGNLPSSSTVWFYTDNTYNNNLPIGYNRLSASTLWKQEVKDPMTPGKMPLWANYDALWGNCTTHTVSGNVGVCFEVGKFGDNWSSIASPMPYFSLSKNTVYRIRATMNSTQTSVGKVPFWDFIVENYNGDMSKGINLYGMDCFYLDNEGGANAILQKTGGTEVKMYWAPPAFNTTQWDGAFTTTYDAVNDPRLRFRVMDVETGQSALRNDLKLGAICLQQVIVESIPFSKMTVVTPGVVNIATPTRTYKKSDGTLVVGNMTAAGLTGTSAGWSGGILKLSPANAATQNEIVTILPCTDVDNHFPSNDALDDWPIKWTSNKLLEMEVKLSAPDSAGQSHPYDVMWMNIEPPSYELCTENFMGSNKALGSPKTGTPQTYIMFYWTGNETKSTVQNMHQLRWRLRFGNSTSLNWPNASDTDNTGSVNVHSVKINEVSFPN